MKKWDGFNEAQKMGEGFIADSFRKSSLIAFIETSSYIFNWSKFMLLLSGQKQKVQECLDYSAQTPSNQ